MEEANRAGQKEHRNKTSFASSETDSLGGRKLIVLVGKCPGRESNMSSAFDRVKEMGKW